MSAADYQESITLRIKDPVTHWIAELQAKEPELLLTKQWKILFPKGFKAGFNCLPVLTGSKHGRHLIAEVEFVLPASLELDLEALELNLKNQAYREDSPAPVGPPSLNAPLDILNGILVNINQFLQGLAPPSNPRLRPLPLPSSGVDPHMAPGAAPSAGIRVHPSADNDLETIRQRLLQNSAWPDWFGTIDSREVREQLITKIAESLAHYQQQIGRTVELPEFFDKYSAMLLTQEKLYHYCKYKSKAVDLDEQQFCSENYCSKKPYRAPCPNATLRFGIKPSNP